MPDPDLEIRGGGGGGAGRGVWGKGEARFPQNFFSALRALVWSKKIRGAGQHTFILNLNP